MKRLIILSISLVAVTSFGAQTKNVSEQTKTFDQIAQEQQMREQGHTNIQGNHGAGPAGNTQTAQISVSHPNNSAHRTSATPVAPRTNSAMQSANNPTATEALAAWVQYLDGQESALCKKINDALPEPTDSDDDNNDF
jgi:hypothetical protein